VKLLRNDIHICSIYISINFQIKALNIHFVWINHLIYKFKVSQRIFNWNNNTSKESFYVFQFLLYARPTCRFSAPPRCSSRLGWPVERRWPPVGSIDSCTYSCRIPLPDSNWTPSRRPEWGWGRWGRSWRYSRRTRECRCTSWRFPPGRPLYWSTRPGSGLCRRWPDRRRLKYTQNVN